MGKEISEKKLKEAEIPPYLRFDLVTLNYMNIASYKSTIVERFEWVQMILQPFKKAFSRSEFEFLGVLSTRNLFKDSSTLLDQTNKLLQIFARCRAYKFYIDSQIYENSSTHVLTAIFQFDAIVRCSKIKLEFHFGSPTHLPIEAIGNWLNRTNANGQNERFMKLKISYDVPNISEMFEYLKEVYLFYFVKLLQDNNFFISAPRRTGLIKFNPTH